MFSFKKRVYLDYASATPVHPLALDATYRALSVFANPGGLHAGSVEAKAHLENSRERIAAQLGCKARELIFTSGLTEANTLAIVGSARALESSKRTLSGTHWLVSSIEHSSVLECFSEVERLGGEVEYIEPGPKGIIAAEAVSAKLRPETVFVSVGWANNEIGVIQPLARISRVIRMHNKTHRTNAVLHSDGGQGPLYLSAHVHTLGVDLLTLGSGKLYGPRGTGCLYISSETHINPTLFGGGQERGLRPGTEDVALAAGFAEALEIVQRERTVEADYVREIRDELRRLLQERFPDILINGDPDTALPHMLNISVPGEKSGEYLALQLDHAGFELSTKSACREGEAASHVVRALGGPDWRAKNTLRFSIGRDTSKRDIERAVATLRSIVPVSGAV